MTFLPSAQPAWSEIVFLQRLPFKLFQSIRIVVLKWWNYLRADHFSTFLSHWDSFLLEVTPIIPNVLSFFEHPVCSTGATSAQSIPQKKPLRRSSLNDVDLRQICTMERWNCVIPVGRGKVLSALCPKTSIIWHVRNVCVCVSEHELAASCVVRLPLLHCCTVHSRK